jgi:hypothetical protein
LCLIAASWSSSHRNTIGWEDPTCIEKSAAIARTFFVSLRKMALSSTCGQLLHHLRERDELHYPRVVGDNLQVYVIQVDYHSSQLSQILDPLLQLQYCTLWRGCSARVSLPSEPFSMRVMSACVDGL